MQTPSPVDYDDSLQTTSAVDNQEVIFREVVTVASPVLSMAEPKVKSQSNNVSLKKAVLKVHQF